MGSELREALTSLNVSPLIPKYIDPDLVELQRRLSPLVGSIPSRQVSNTVYNFNTRSQRPGAGAVSDGGTRPQTQSSYQQNQFTMCHYLADGGVTGFAQAVTQDLIGDLLREEMDGAMASLLWTIENAMLWSNFGSTQNGMYPGMDGFDTQISQFAATAGSAPVNAIDCGGAALSFSLLNQLIDLVAKNAAMPVMNTSYELIGSTTAISAIAALITSTQQRINDTVTLPDSGINVEGYRGLPLVPSSFMSSVEQVGAITTTPSTSAGTLAAGTYGYQVGAVLDRIGELATSANVNATLGATGEVTISLPTIPTYEGAGPIVFKVFRGGTLLGYVDATVGTAADQITPIPTTSIIDTGTALVPQNGSTVPAILPTTYFNTNAGHLPRTVGKEDLFLVARTPDKVLRPFTRDMEVLNVAPTLLSPDTLPWAVISDTCLATKASKYMARLRNVGVAL